MRDRKNIAEQLSAYLDGELSDEQARRVRKALKDDPSLARELEALKAARELVHSLPPHKAPEDFTAAVLERAERLRLVAPAPVAAGRWSINWVSLATAAIVLITVGIGVVVTLRLTLTPSWTEKVARKQVSNEPAATTPSGSAATKEVAATPVALAPQEAKSLRSLGAVSGSLSQTGAPSPTGGGEEKAEALSVAAAPSPLAGSAVDVVTGDNKLFDRMRGFAGPPASAEQSRTATSQPASAPATAPASQPASAPASQPAKVSEPSSQPAVEPPSDVPIFPLEDKDPSAPAAGSQETSTDNPAE
jgi:anti-sigma factor RsiW